jgi:hypothetical protein
MEREKIYCNFLLFEMYECKLIVDNFDEYSLQWSAFQLRKSVFSTNRNTLHYYLLPHTILCTTLTLKGINLSLGLIVYHLTLL